MTEKELNDKWQIHDIIQDALSKAHMEPSPETKKNQEITNLALNGLKNDIQYIQRDVSEIKSKLDSNYITKIEFEPIKKIVYGLISLVMVGVVGALLALIIK